MIKFVYTNPLFKRYKYIFTSLKALNFSKIKSLQKEIVEKKGKEKKGIENKGKEKISALKYFTKLEIFCLFFIPFAFVSIYIFFMWNLFKYICGIKDIPHFLKLIQWLNGKESYPFYYLHNKTIEKKSQPIIMSVKKFA
ncbi:hypothetical protein YYC_01644 [Plasmodium yoelii 17X]|uniref:Uncharacterized protein n=2 Tax=Plasmodium yoelii TaxID=5861 RepID=A0A078KG41_PLAYE|nr:conserved Plasmodium protein, unknown function [Plasmodium yoelii]ETB61833.1 hypothetical protein YYC_01644 [Plasmodium yoelii 17X]CDU20845.1 conserved Plasmodium protein, unknown function [Plasmodium yoelii]VTZ81808.1 conserved Plasmodium protein, unknown function [Plasmodium yoelii]|eukprot:XP_022813004.1 conserved Plasmodium protein, unknown function [Plasmodium yoelii]